MDKLEFKALLSDKNRIQGFEYHQTLVNTGFQFRELKAEGYPELNRLIAVVWVDFR